jgi:LPXTG-motif cell wall-anchored protein
LIPAVIYSSSAVKSVRLATIIAAAAVSVTLPGQALAAGSPSSQITSTAPARLTQTRTTSAALPNTGLNLMPETVVGLALLGAGVGLRARRSRG